MTRHSASVRHEQWSERLGCNLDPRGLFKAEGVITLAARPAMSLGRGLNASQGELR
jgi:hypothetical protein